MNSSIRGSELGERKEREGADETGPNSKKPAEQRYNICKRKLFY